MTRKEFEELVFDIYNVRADYPFEDDLVTGISYDLTRTKTKRK